MSALIEFGADAPAQEAPRPVLELILGILDGAAKSGVTAFIPPPWGLLAATVLKLGVPVVRAKLLAQPVKERWTIDDIDARIAAVAEPAT